MRRLDCIVGICDATPLPPALYESSTTPFVSKNTAKRTDPTATLPGAQSIIVVGVPWPEAPDDEMLYSADFAEISSLAWLPDYHPRVRAVIQSLITELQRTYTFKYKILVDNPGLDERVLALRAGLGFYGRHGLVISPRYGTRFNIGCLITDITLLDLPPTPTLPQACQLAPNWNQLKPYDASPHANQPVASCDRLKSCNRCVRACPTQALPTQPGGTLNVNRCISYLTQKETLSPEEAALVGNQLYGCDICQQACPHNTPWEKKYINPADWLSKSDEDFQREYKNTAMMWRNADILRRNAQAVLNNIKTCLNN